MGSALGVSVSVRKGATRVILRIFVAVFTKKRFWLECGVERIRVNPAENLAGGAEFRSDLVGSLRALLLRYIDPIGR